MFFEKFEGWGEDKLGLIAAMSFVLIGVLGYVYLIYLMRDVYIAPLYVLLLFVAIALSAVAASFFQMPRIRGMRAAISTFFGGIAICLTVILWVVSWASISTEFLKLVLIAAISGGMVFLAFFAVGFLLLAFFPESAEMKLPSAPTTISKPAPKMESKTKKKTTASAHKKDTHLDLEDEDEDFIERL